MLFRLWLFSFAAMAGFALFGPHPAPFVGEWMLGQVVVLNNDNTFGFQPDGKDYWYTVRDEGGEDKGWRVGQVVTVQKIEFTKDGVMRARVR